MARLELMTHRGAVLALVASLASACGGAGGGDRIGLSVSVRGSGTVTSSTDTINCGAACVVDVPANTSVTLTATPAAGSLFEAWGGDCSGAGNTCTITISRATSVSATFVVAPTDGWSGSVATLSSGGSCCAKAAIDTAGRAIAVWLTREPGTPTDNLMESHFDPGTGWSAPTALESNPGDVVLFELAMDQPSGRAVVVWTQRSDTRAGAVFARTFEPATGWSAAELIQSASTPAGQADRVSVGMDALGNVVAAWSQLDGTRISVWGNHRAAAGTWSGARLLETMDELGRADGNPRIGVSPQGDALVVWQASGGTVANRGIWTNRYSAGVGWGTASQLVAVSGGSAPDLAMDGNGNALMVWGQIETFSPTEMYMLIQAKHYQAGAWGGATQVARELGANSVLSAPRVAVNATGSALVVWGQGDASIRANVSPSGASWPAPAIVKAPGGRAVASGLVAAIDGRGTTMIAWAQNNAEGGADGLLATRSAQRSWSTMTQQPSIWGDAFITMNEGGDALFLWTQYADNSTGTTVQARRLTSP
jgi:hypothetical protein